MQPLAKDFLLTTPERVLETFARQNPGPGSCLLLSGDPTHAENKTSFFGLRPEAEFCVHPHEVTLKKNGTTYTLGGHPLDALEKLLRDFGIFDSAALLVPDKMVCGFFSYEFSQFTQDFPRHHRIHFPKSKTNFPLAWFGFYKNISVYHHAAQTFQDPFRPPAPLTPTPFFTDPFCSDITRSEYLKKLETILNFIKAGDIYQANFAHQFKARCRSSNFLPFFNSIQAQNPAPFSAYIHVDEHHTVLSASPERLFSVHEGVIETHPIKGTAARLGDFAADQRQRQSLLHSKKDLAELTMIVDLLRNDLGKVCVPGSVTVKCLAELQTFASVHHLVAKIRGHLRDDFTFADILRAVFPGGSITGAPKIRAMEIISQLEKAPRDIYTGCIGYFAPGPTADFNIAIRTAWTHDNTMHLATGSGIVADSVPECEYQETLNKIKPFLSKGKKVWTTLPSALAP